MGYPVKRFLLFVPTVVLVSMVVFAVMRILPGDPALVVLMGESGEGRYTEEELATVRRQIGTDQPLPVQYQRWIWNMLHGDFGHSFFYRVAVLDEITTRLPVTLELAVLTLVASFILSVPLGVISAAYQDRWPDRLATLFTVAGMALPTFWVGVLTVYVLSRWANWLPPLAYARPWEDLVVNLQQLIFPVLTLGYYNVAFQTRVTRSAMLDVLREDYVRTAYAKGLGGTLVVTRHALKNALLPVITVSGWQFSRLLGGAVLIEVIFVVPGIGNLLVESVVRRDFNVVQALVLLTTILGMLVNLLVDLLYGWLDPRIHYQ
jgi:peptide/nickel transport system permease protein